MDGLERDAIIVTKTDEQDSVQVTKKTEMEWLPCFKKPNLPRHENNKDKREPKAWKCD